MSTQTDSIPHVKRRITFVKAEEWCASSATKAVEYVAPGTQAYLHHRLRDEEAIDVLGFHCPPIYVGYVDGATLLPRVPTFLSADGCLPIEYFFYKPQVAYFVLKDFADETSVTEALRVWKATGRAHLDVRVPVETHAIDGEAIFLGGNDNFGHLLNEDLLRIPIFQAIAEMRDKPVLVYDFVPKRFIDFIVLAGIDRDRIVRIPSKESIACERVWFATRPIIRRFDSTIEMWPDALHQLRAKLLAHVPLKRWDRRERIFLPRPPGAHRMIANQSEVAEVFRKRGFRVLDLADFSAEEQIALVGSCEVIAGPHGAAMSVSALAPQDSLVLQLASDSYLNMYNSDIQAFMIGQKFDSFTGTPIPSAIRAMDLDYTVPIAKLEAYLDSVLPTRS